MNTIVIPVSKDRPEDDILTLAETFKSVFPSGVIKVSDALVIETDIPPVAAIFKQIAGSEIKTSNNGTKSVCLDCGRPVSKEGRRCKSCNMKVRAAKARLEVSDEQDA